MKVNWSVFKAFIDDRSLSIQETPMNQDYRLEAFDGPIHRLCIVREDSADRADYVANYQANANATQTDGNNIQKIRNAMAPPGWHYQARCIDFETSVLASIVNKDHAGADIGDASIALYDNVGTLITVQATADTDCVKTVIDWEPLHDIEIIGGFISPESAISENVYCYIVAVPDVPAGSGGSKPMVNGLNFKFVGSGDRLNVDGRTSKRLNYNATYHTSKLRLIMNHAAGSKFKFHTVYEHYKA